MREQLKTQHIERWEQMLSEVDRTMRAQYNELMNLAHDEFLEEMQALEEQKGTDSGPHT